MDVQALEMLVIKMNGHDYGVQGQTLDVNGIELKTVDQLIETIKQQLKFKKTASSRIYSPQGILLHDDDVVYLRNGDILYYDYKGKSFDPKQVVDQYEKDVLLGEGGFGRVYRGRHKETGEMVALKYIDLSSQMKNASQIQEIDREANTLKMLNHKNIIKLYQGLVIKNELLLIMEYADGGELINYVEEKKGLTEIECRALFKQLISAIDVCHSQGIVHRDLKLENVLFESKARSRIKVVDFGIAGRCTPSVTDKTDAGTLRYMAPEVLNGSDTKAKPAIDIWAIGCMLYCMLFYKFPFNGESGHQVKDKIINQELRFPSDQALTEECSDMIRGLLTKDPAQRYTLAAIKQHKWLLLSDSAIQMKVDIAQQNLDRELEKKRVKEEQKKLQAIGGGLALPYHYPAAVGESSSHSEQKTQEEEKTPASNASPAKRQGVQQQYPPMVLQAVNAMRRKSNITPMLNRLSAAAAGSSNGSPHQIQAAVTPSLPPSTFKPRMSAVVAQGSQQDGLLNALAKTLGSKIKAMQKQEQGPSGGGGSRMGTYLTPQPRKETNQRSTSGSRKKQ